MAAAGVQVVRWFVFADARGGIAIDGRGWPPGFLDGHARRPRRAVRAWRSTPGSASCRCSSTTPWPSAPAESPAPSWAAIASGWAIRRGSRACSTSSSAGGPPVRRPRRRTRISDGAVFAWDLLNEPDWLVTELHPSRRTTPMPFDVLAAWVRDAAGEIRRHEAGAVTVGGARLRFASWWDDPRLRPRLPAGARLLRPGARPRRAQHAAAALGLTRPAGARRVRGAGRCRQTPPPAGPPSTSAALARAALRGGYAGAWPWSWRGVDAHGAVGADVMRSPWPVPTRARAGRCAASSHHDRRARADRARRRPRRARAPGRVRRPAP